MEKIVKLLVTLLDKTERGTIGWQATADDEIFQYPLADGTIRIEHDRGNYYLSVLNDEAKIVDYVSNDELDSRSPHPRIHFEMMRKLFGLARRRALNAEATLDGILNELSVEA